MKNKSIKQKMAAILSKLNKKEKANLLKTQQRDGKLLCGPEDYLDFALIKKDKVFV